MARMRSRTTWGALVAVCALLVGCAGEEIVNDENAEDLVYYRVRGHVVAPGRFFPDQDAAAVINSAAEALAQPEPFSAELVENWGAAAEAGCVKAVAVKGVWNQDFYNFRREYGLPVRVFCLGRRGTAPAQEADEVVPVYAEVLMAERPYERRIQKYLSLAPARQEFVDMLNADYLRRTKGGEAQGLVGAEPTAAGVILESEKPKPAKGGN